MSMIALSSCWSGYSCTADGNLTPAGAHLFGIFFPLFGALTHFSLSFSFQDILCQWSHLCIKTCFILITVYLHHVPLSELCGCGYTVHSACSPQCQGQATTKPACWASSDVGRHWMNVLTVCCQGTIKSSSQSHGAPTVTATAWKVRSLSCLLNCKTYTLSDVSESSNCLSPIRPCKI